MHCVIIWCFGLAISGNFVLWNLQLGPVFTGFYKLGVKSKLRFWLSNKTSFTDLPCLQCWTTHLQACKPFWDTWYHFSVVNKWHDRRLYFKYFDVLGIIQKQAPMWDDIKQRDLLRKVNRVYHLQVIGSFKNILCVGSKFSLVRPKNQKL